MPMPVKRIENTTRHWTNEEKARRSEAEKELERRFVRLIAPARVVADPVAYGYWKTTINRMRGITLLDNVDTDLLASYCLARAREDALRDDYEKARGSTDKTIQRTLDRVLAGFYADQDYPAKVIRTCLGNELSILKMLQAQERIVLGYQRELGLTPAGRQRLAKRKADERPVTEEDELYGD